MQKKGTLNLLSLLLSILLYAQSLPYEKYTLKKGLISDRITAITQDEKGFMWFGSYFGICRYDGMKFEKIVLPAQQRNKYVNCLSPAIQMILKDELNEVNDLPIIDKGEVIGLFNEMKFGKRLSTWYFEEENQTKRFLNLEEILLNKATTVH